jgi:hypothetical protein
MKKSSGGGMPNFNREHWTKDAGKTSSANGKYTSGEMDNPQHLKNSVDGLASYAKKNKMNYP